MFVLSDVKPTLHVETGCIRFDFKTLAIAQKRGGTVPCSHLEQLMLSLLIVQAQNNTHLLTVGSQMLPTHQENEKTNTAWEPSVCKNYNRCHTVILQSDFLK